MTLLEALETLKKHIVLLAFFGGMLFALANKIVWAEEFDALEKAVVDHQIKDAARWELLSIKRQLDNYKRKPVDLRESWEIDEIKRLERQEILLEKKINS